MKAFILFISTCITTVICGLDYVSEVSKRQDVVNSRKSATQWSLLQRNKNWGWGTTDFPETHRIMTSLYLSGEMQNETESLQYQLSVKQLQMELLVALSRSDKQVSAGQLGLYANALLATCQDPNNFYGHNIVEKMRSKPKLSAYEEALVSLAVSNSGNRLNKTELIHYFDLLDKLKDSHSMPDTKAMIVLALSSAMKSYRRYRFVERHLRQPLKAFKKSQSDDGSFGNIYSSALVIQSLIGADDKGNGWSFEKGIDFLLSQQKEDGSFGDILATYFVLPVLAGRSLVSLRYVTCNATEQSLEDDDLEDELLNETKSVLYSIWGNTNISDEFTILKNSTFLDVMKVAEEQDEQYSFSGVEYSWGYYVKTIGGLDNDVVCNKYWMLYKEDRMTGEIVPTQNGVTKEIPQDGDHYIYRYMKMQFSISTESDVTCKDYQQNNETITTTDSSIINY